MNSTESTEQDPGSATPEQTQEPEQSQMQEPAPEQTQEQFSAAAPQGPIDESVYLSTLEPIAVESGVDPDRRYASAGSDSAVPLDDSSHPSVDVSAQYPWSLGVTGIYRNLNIAQIRSLHLDFGHEPSLQLSIDPSGKLSLQSAITLVNLHWMPPWNREVELGLSGLVNTTILPRLSNQYGGQLQAEQHVFEWFSITLSANGGWTPGASGQPGKFELTGSAGAVIHFDGF